MKLLKQEKSEMIDHVKTKAEKYRKEKNPKEIIYQRLLILAMDIEVTNSD